jgi:hypothetical protein
MEHFEFISLMIKTVKLIYQGTRQILTFIDIYTLNFRIHSTYVEVLLWRFYMLHSLSDRSKMELPLCFTSKYNAYKLKHTVKKAGKNRVQLEHCMM